MSLSFSTSPTNCGAACPRQNRRAAIIGNLMEQALRAVIDLNEVVWKSLKEVLKNIPLEEANWRPLPQANSINLIVRHLRIEADWKLASLERGEPEPIENTESLQRFIDSIGFDFEQNVKELDALCT